MKQNEKRISEIREQIHEAMFRKNKQCGKTRDEIVTENRMIKILCSSPAMSPFMCAEKMNECYGYDFRSDDVLEIYRKLKLANPNERLSVFWYADKDTDRLVKALNGDRKAFETLSEIRCKTWERRHPASDRICAAMLFRKYPDIVTDGDDELLNRLGNTIARYFFCDILEIIRTVYNIPVYAEKQKNITAKNLSEEQLRVRINVLENELETTANMLSDLQCEFEEQLSESRIKEMTDFFARLNSDKYGCILDQLLELQKGVNELKNKGYEVPVELNGVLIVIRKLIQFVRDCHIVPVLKPWEQRTVKASDIEFCDYSGTPFESEDEEKNVQTVSPGWQFSDRGIRISRPRVKETV